MLLKIYFNVYLRRSVINLLHDPRSERVAVYERLEFSAIFVCDFMGIIFFQRNVDVLNNYIKCVLNSSYASTAGHKYTFSTSILPALWRPRPVTTA